MSGGNSDEKQQWKEEAEAVIADVQHHVRIIAVSSKLQSTSKKIYLNLITLEEQEFCIEMTTSGFRIAGKKMDSVDDDSNQIFETPYSLLESISPLYTESFGNQLIQKLSSIQAEANEESS